MKKKEREMWASFPQLLAVTPKSQRALTMKALVYSINKIGHTPTIDELKEWSARERLAGTGVIGVYISSMLDRI